MNFSNLWDKIVAWFKGEFTTVELTFTKEEQEILTLMKPLLVAAEATVVQDLMQFIRGVLTGAAGYSTLADWETAVMNGLEKVGGDLLTLAKGLGSNMLQALIGLILAQLPNT